jgi:serine/threonine-protein kinase
MANGRRLTRGESPKWQETPGEQFKHVVERCLAEDPENRWQAASDVSKELEWASKTHSEHQRPVKSRPNFVRWAAGGLLLAVAAGSGFMLFHGRPAEQPLTQFMVDFGPDAIAAQRTTVAISRDGRRIVFPTKGGLATRTLDQANATSLSGTAGAQDAFVSPDGQWIAFFADSKLKKVAVQGGAPVILCDAPGDRGGNWGDDGNIIFQPSTGTNAPLFLVPPDGGMPKPVTRFEKGDVTHRWPQLLPGAKAVLFTVAIQPANYDTANLEVLSLKSGERKTVLRGGYYGRYLHSQNEDYLIYIRENTLFAVAFDLEKLELRGTPAPVIEGVGGDSTTGGGQFDIAQSGLLIYRSGQRSLSRALAWMDPAGRSTALSIQAGGNPRFSPDGMLLAYHLPSSKARDIWIYDIERDIPKQVTFSNTTTGIAWTPDGKHLAYGAGSPPYGLWWIRTDGSGEPRQLQESDDPMWPESFTQDSRRLAYVHKGADIWTLPLDLSDPDHPKAGKPEPFLTTAALETDYPAFSPDGRWLAYQSNESGRPEVYVRQFPGPGGKWRISSEGGRFPVWSRKERDLLFQGADGRVMVSEYTAQGGSFSPGKPRTWSPTAISLAGVFNSFDLHPDGKRLIVFLRPEDEESKGNLHANVVLNFADELRRHLPPAGK